MEVLKIVLDKLSQYNFLTNIIPGTILCIILKYLIGYDMMLTDTYLAGILFYFVGMVNSRVSSLLVEPFLKWVKWLVFAPYSDFVRAEKADVKISVLSQENNTYRAYVSVMFISLGAYIYRNYIAVFEFINQHETAMLLLLLALIFLLAYRKQTNYVRKRVETNIKSINSEARQNNG